ncbi:MAG: inositol monophosphatase [bacterium]|nr:inositol monophosphatase [bacterium]
MTWRDELNLAVEAARAAGERLRAIAAGEKAVLSVAGRDIKLQADRDSESLILGMLAARSPHPVLAEESGECGTIAEGAAPFWVVDPLDGTLNFSRGVPLCCVSIALVEGTAPRLGVVYDFNRGELFYGVPGDAGDVHGGIISPAGERPLAVSGVAERGKAILATGFPVNRDFGAAALAEFVDQVKSFKKVRLLGSAALSLAWVAAGRVDAYAEDDIMLWDVAAGLALVAAAGGHVALAPSARLKWARRVRAASTPPLIS